MSRLGRVEQEIVRAIEDEAIARCRLPDGRVDHVAAAGRRQDELAALEAGGQMWAASVRDAAEAVGHRKAISRRLKNTVVTIPAPEGTVTMPSAYSLRRKDGAQQMSLWLHVDLGALVMLIDEMEVKAGTLSDRALAMRCGLELARKHKVATAAEGFDAEGIDVGTVAA